MGFLENLICIHRKSRKIDNKRVIRAVTKIPQYFESYNLDIGFLKYLKAKNLFTALK